MDISSISAASISMHSAQTLTAAGVAVLKKTMDAQEDALASIVNMVVPSVPQDVGVNFDTFA